MGALYRSVCFPSADLARAEVCAGSSMTWADGASVYTSSCTSTDFTQSTYDLCVSLDGGPCTVKTLSYPAFPPCDYGDVHQDLMALWSLGLAAIVAVLLAKWLYSIFSPARRSDDPL